MMHSVQRFLVALFVVLFLGGLQSSAAPAAPTTPTADFTDNNDGTVTHNITGLTCKAAPPINGLATTAMVAAGSNHSIALKNDGTLVAVGDDSYGQLGLGRLVQSSTPLQVLGLGQVRTIAAGDSYTVALNQDGTVWAWGKNDNGQLGDGTTTSRGLPAQVTGLTGVSAIATNSDHTFALKQDGTVWVWGSNEYGQLGDGTTTSRNSPVQVMGLAGVTAIAAGYDHALALKQDGTVWLWGYNYYGELGDGTATNRSTPGPVPGLTGITAIVAGNRFSLALKQDGTVWAWGRNDFGQLGDGTTTSDYAGRSTPGQVMGLTGVAAIAAGSYFSIAMKQDGTVWAWGENNSGTLGDGTQTNRSTPVRVKGLTGITVISAGNWHALALKQDGTVWAWGTNYYGDLGNGTVDQIFPPVVYSTPEPVQGLSGVTTIAAGWYNSVAMKQGGAVWMWGSNDYGQLGNVTPTTRSTPMPIPGLTGVAAIAAGLNYSLALKQDGSVWAWGDNFYGQLGDGTSTNRSTPVQVPGLSGVVAVAAGEYHTLALKPDGTVWAWGWNVSSQLGDGATTLDAPTPVQVTGLSGVTAIAAGSWYGHSLALKQDGTVWAWGDNKYGQLGDGTTTNRSMPAPVPGLSGITAIAAGHFYSLALKQDGTVWAWGKNDRGQLGTTSSSMCNPFGGEPSPCSEIVSQVSGISGVTVIAPGYDHALALEQDGTILAWGANYSGQLGNDSNLDLFAPAQVQGLTGITAISAGGDAGFAMKPDGTVWAWGGNWYGQLGDGTYSQRPLAALMANETIDAPLDLIPEIPNTISANKIPPFFLAASKSGDLNATNLSATLKGNTAPNRYASGYNVYVAAMTAGLLSGWWQLDMNRNWSNLTWPMAAFMTGVALDSQGALVKVEILHNADLSQLRGSAISLGYGADPDEMLRAGRYRDIFTIPLK